MKPKALLVYQMYSKIGFKNTFQLALKHKLNLVPSFLTLGLVFFFFAISITTVFITFFFRGEFYFPYILTLISMVCFIRRFNIVSFQVQRMEPDHFIRSRDDISATSENNSLNAFLAEFKALPSTDRDAAVFELEEYLDSPNPIEENKYVAVSTSIIIVPTILIRLQDDIQRGGISFYLMLLLGAVIAFFGKTIMRHLSWKRLTVAAILKNIKKGRSSK